MSWISRLVEQQLADAAAAGDLVAEPLKGKPIPGIDEQRPDGWWASSFVRRELSHDRRIAAKEQADRARVGFWKASSVEELRELVGAANADLAAANVNLVESDQLDLFDPREVVDRWHALGS